ncbi:hypothetical protein LJC63_09585, partial [Ruminococcaceae bacterium OttesenSCG-928-L11]|nr:hypothetical protein [Ruminococcaceae bacterium OttesenSCG-928-L11]
MLKRILSFLIVAGMVFGMGMGAFASTTSKADGAILPIDTNYNEDYNVGPDDEIIFPLTADMFSWKDGTVRTKAAIKKSQLSNITFDVRSLPSKILSKSDISFADKTVNVSGLGNVKTACLVIKFKDNWAINELD